MPLSSFHSSPKKTQKWPNFERIYKFGKQKSKNLHTNLFKISTNKYISYGSRCCCWHFNSCRCCFLSQIKIDSNRILIKLKKVLICACFSIRFLVIVADNVLKLSVLTTLRRQSQPSRRDLQFFGANDVNFFINHQLWLRNKDFLLPNINWSDEVKTNVRKSN